MLPRIPQALFPFVIKEHEYEQHIIVASIDEPLVLGFDFLAQYKCTIDAAGNSLHIGQIPVTRNQRSISMSSCNKRVSEDTVLPPSSETVIKGRVEGNSYLTEGILEPYSEKLTQSGVVVARALVNLTDGFVSMQIGKFTNETITVFKDTVAAVCDEASQIETDNPIELQ